MTMIPRPSSRTCAQSGIQSGIARDIVRQTLRKTFLASLYVRTPDFASSRNLVGNAKIKMRVTMQPEARREGDVVLSGKNV
ncbi:hypothetical protein Abac_052_016 [Acetobacter aceti NBRC 14818]|uniref:Uncharacterized protein n=1 Tax=Acetobacter aceti TaxID=435 RepID=A0A6S6PIG9_ACEAC|nr:hypothetical protein AAJCM20276_10450 [Acetobacter aceti]GAN58445.1 hypothetical protein Abac_052_016 [Acetobacter aceti NBRC 14818]